MYYCNVSIVSIGVTLAKNMVICHLFIAIMTSALPLIMTFLCMFFISCTIYAVDLICNLESTASVFGDHSDCALAKGNRSPIQNVCIMLKPKQSSSSGNISNITNISELKDDSEDDEPKMKLQINIVHQTLSSQDEAEAKGAKVADEVKPDIEVEDLSKKDLSKKDSGIELGSIISFEKEKFPTSSFKRAKKVEEWNLKERKELKAERRRLTKAQKDLSEQTKNDKESLFLREMKLTKAQKQTKNDNDLLFQREMKLWQDKKDLCKERKTFDAVMVVGRKELRKGKERGGGRRLQEQASKEKGYSTWKVRPNLNCISFCFGSALLSFFFIASVLILVILLNLMPDFDNSFG